MPCLVTSAKAVDSIRQLGCSVALDIRANDASVLDSQDSAA